jgi:hypothetical protein
VICVSAVVGERDERTNIERKKEREDGYVNETRSKVRNGR